MSEYQGAQFNKGNSNSKFNPISPAKDVDNYHNNSDKDSGDLAQHHTLGWKPGQAAPGVKVRKELDGLGKADTALEARVTTAEADINALEARYFVGDMKNSFQTADHGRWLLLNGQNVSRTTYSELFTFFGTTYGAGDGSTTFGLPDFRDRSAVGVSDTKAMGSTGGAATKTLTTAEIPSHSHDMAHGHSSRSTGVDGGSTLAFRRSDNVSVVSGGGMVENFAGATGNTGGGTAFSIQNPYRAVNFFVWAGVS